MLNSIRSRNICSSVLYNFLEQCLHLEPTKRPTCHDLLRHPFIEQAFSSNVINPDETPILTTLKVPPTSQEQVDVTIDAVIEL